MPKRNIPVQIDNSAFRLADLVRRSRGLAKSVEAQAWGSIGSVLGYVGGALWGTSGKPFLNRVELCSLAYVIAIASYAILSRSIFATNRCLFVAKLMFVNQKINQAEYDKIRSRCLKKAGLM
jgi:hypothetical protein